MFEVYDISIRYLFIVKRVVGVVGVVVVIKHAIVRKQVLPNV